MTTTTVTRPAISAPEIEIVLRSARHGGDARQHGRERGRRAGMRLTRAAGAAAAAVWAFDLWLAVHPGL